MAPWKPSPRSNRPPRKKPRPFIAFFDPVSPATQRKSLPSGPPSTTSLMELLALILLRSLAIPEMACAHISQTTLSICTGTKSIDNAISCKNSPMCIVLFSPIRAPSQPPVRLVITPKNS
mgnify:CR=1 FL=1